MNMEKKIKDFELKPEGSLGVLALGDIGVEMWRKVRDAAKSKDEKKDGKKKK